MATIDIIKNMDFDTYQRICNILWYNEDADLADIAIMAGATLAEVQYVASAEEED